MRLETRLAEGHWTRTEARDRIKTYNLMTGQGLRAQGPSFDFTRWLRGRGLDESALAETIVRQPNYLSTLSSTLDDMSLADLRDWLRFHLLSSAASYLSSAFVDQHFAFYGRTLTGTAELKVRWKRGVGLVNELLPEAVGEAYVARHFPPESKTLIEDLVANLEEAYRRDIERLDWMGPETRARALAKLAKFRSKVGYPTRWRDYSSVEVRPDDLLGNVMRLEAFETDRQFAKLGKPIDHDEWLMSPQTINAYYNPGMNESCFPAGDSAAPVLRPNGRSGAELRRNWGDHGA